MSDDSVISHRDVIALWPSIRAYADDIGVSRDAAKGMNWRDSIPGRYWAVTVERAVARGLSGVTLKVLADGAQGRSLREDVALELHRGAS